MFPQRVLIVCMSLILTITRSESEANSYPDIQITAFTRLNNIVARLNITDDAINVKSLDNHDYTIIELHCTAQCPLKWNFNPAKEKLEHVFTDIQIEVKDNEFLHNSILIINSTSNEMTGTYSCECSENSTSKKEVQLYWPEQGKSTYVNAGMTLFKFIDPRNTAWVELPCGYSNPDSDQERFLYTKRMIGDTNVFRRKARSSSTSSRPSIVSDRHSGFKLNITEMPWAWITESIWICTTSNYSPDWQMDNTVHTLFRILDPLLSSSNRSTSKVRHDTASGTREMECCSPTCHNCTLPTVKVYTLNNAQTGEFLRPLFHRHVTQKIDSAAEQKQNKNAGNCSSLPVKATEKTVGFFVECTTPEVEFSESQNFHTEYKYIEFDAETGLLPSELPPRFQYEWIILAGVVFIVLLRALYILYKKVSKRNPDLEKLVQKYKSCLKDWIVPRSDWTPGPPNPPPRTDWLSKTIRSLLSVFRSPEAAPDPAQPVEFLGKGNFGEVLKGKLKRRSNRKLIRRPNRKRTGPDGIPIAYKQVDVNITKSTAGLSYLECLLKEVEIMIKIQNNGGHPNIVKFYGVTTSEIQKKSIYILMECCANRNLRDYLKQKRGSRWSTNSTTFAIVYKWCMEISRGLKFMSDHGIIHIDVAARNILLTDDLVAKISDFGLSRELYKTDVYKILGMNIPTEWAAPEAFEINHELSVKSDIWSFGVTVWEIFALGAHPTPVQQRIGGRLARPDRCDPGTYGIILKCMDKDPKSRPPFEDLASYFKQAYQRRSVNVEPSSTSEEAGAAQSGLGRTTYRIDAMGDRQNVDMPLLASNEPEAVTGIEMIDIGGGASETALYDNINRFEQEDAGVVHRQVNIGIEITRLDSEESSNEATTSV